MGDDPVLSRLGIARKAGFLEPGFERAAAAIRRGRAALAVVAADVSPKTEKELRHLAAGKTEILRIRASQSELSRATGVRAGVAAITENGLAQAIRKAEVWNDKV